MLVYLIFSDKKETWDNGFGWNGLSKVLANPSAYYVKPAPPEDKDYGQKTYAGCNCTSYGTKTNMNMPFNDDSSLYKDSIYQHY